MLGIARLHTYTLAHLGTKIDAAVMFLDDGSGLFEEMFVDAFHFVFEQKAHFLMECFRLLLQMRHAG